MAFRRGAGDAPAERDASPSSRAVFSVLLATQECVLEVVLRDILAESDSGEAGERIVHAGPQPGVDDLGAEVVDRVEMPNCVQVAGGTRGGEAVGGEGDLAGGGGGRGYPGLRPRHRPRRGRVPGVGRGGGG